MKNIIAPFVLALVLWWALLAIPSCGHLDPIGVYQGDKVLYDSDLLLGGAYDTIDGFLTWELKYRGTAFCPPAATKAADTLRREAPNAFADAWGARTAYVTAKNDETSTNLQKTLAVVRQLLSIAVSWTATRAAHP